MELVGTVRELREKLALPSAKKGAERPTIGFVPTMGALHAGHISLVERARAENDIVVVSIFVNPTQFNDPEDLRKYPRTLDNDLALLKGLADVVFAPTAGEVYPEPDTRVFDFGTVGEVMEGSSRPGHFNGVGQVVSRLLEMVPADRVYFGEKDFQQIAVVKSLVRQLGIKVDIVECPIVREPDGLAMSSRNTLLTPAHRAAAPKIYAALKKAAGMKGGMSVAELERWVTDEIEKDPLLKVIYFNIVDPETLTKAADWGGSKEKRGCIAVQAGNVRLIDNISI